MFITLSRFFKFISEEKQAHMQLKMTTITVLVRDACDFASFSILDFSFLLLRLTEKHEAFMAGTVHTSAQPAFVLTSNSTLLSVFHLKFSSVFL